MSVGTPHCPSRRRISAGNPLLRLCVSLLIAVGILSGLFLQGLRGQDKKEEEKPPPAKAKRGENKPTKQPAEPPAAVKQGKPKVAGRPVAPPLAEEPEPEQPEVVRFHFTIDPATPLKDLLPMPPKVKTPTGPLLGDDLAQVPEVRFQASARYRSTKEATRVLALQMARINHLNKKKTDGFLHALIEARPDLQGMPFRMGDACRSKGRRNRRFANAVMGVRSIFDTEDNDRPQGGGALPPFNGVDSQREKGLLRSEEASEKGEQTSPQFASEDSTSLVWFAPEDSTSEVWDEYQKNCFTEDGLLDRADRQTRSLVMQTRVAALMQILTPEKLETRLGMIRFLATVPHADATRALAKLALFSAEDDVRQAALDALKVRRERDYTDLLLAGLRYPWPAVSRRAADAVVKLERNDLVPRLVAMLDEPDPRAPVLETVEHKQVPVVRELVRINHHRNCLLCHAPANTGEAAQGTVTGGVPVPTEPLANSGYGADVPQDLMVRVDVTYLRQDFSVRLPVENAHPWPEMQRFDFLVRKRVLTEEEAAAYRKKLQPRSSSRLSPYHRAALAALRELTGRDTGPTGKEWRHLLEQMESRKNGPGQKPANHSNN